MKSNHESTILPPNFYPKEFNDIYELDPAKSDGAERLFQSKIPIEIRIESDNHEKNVGVIENIIVSLYRKEEYGHSLTYRINLISESDLFFNYSSEINNDNYKQVQETNKLQLTIEEFGQAILKMFTKISEDASKYFLMFKMNKGGYGVLEVYQDLQYKYIELLKLGFACATENEIRQNISFRYSVIQAKHRYLTEKLGDMTAIIKLKNHSLLGSLQKAFKLD